MKRLKFDGKDDDLKKFLGICENKPINVGSAELMIYLLGCRIVEKIDAKHCSGKKTRKKVSRPRK